MNRVTQRFETLDMHTCAEPVRIIVGGYPELKGNTILEKRRDALTHHDAIRKALMLEPRGHAGMYGVIPTAPCAPDADLAVLFTHNEGYSTMCGHATVAIGRWAVDHQKVASEAGHARFRLETPCGVVAVEVTPAPDGGSVVAFDSVPSFASHLDLTVSVPGFGEVVVDIAFGGAYYAIFPSSRLGLPFDTTPLPDLVDAATRVTNTIRQQIAISHPEHKDLSFLYGTILTDDAMVADDVVSRHLCVFAEGQIDRSPTGSGVTARMALDYAKGLISQGHARRFSGVSGGVFDSVLLHGEGRGTAALATVTVSGEAHYAAQSTFIIESFDPMAEGFTLPACYASLGSAA